jgi:hypothetical protein
MANAEKQTKETLIIPQLKFIQISEQKEKKISFLHFFVSKLAEIAS